MLEVTNENFNTIYPHLERTLKNANFIAIDTELTGINVDDVKNRLVYILLNARLNNVSMSLNNISMSFNVVFHCSLFDSINERYEKQRSSIRPYIIIQFGITAFQRIQHENQYTAEAFNFFLLPRSIPSKNRQFVWQIAALEFLTAYEFDFNKVYRILFINYFRF